MINSLEVFLFHALLLNKAEMALMLRAHIYLGCDATCPTGDIIVFSIHSTKVIVLNTSSNEWYSTIRINT